MFGEIKWFTLPCLLRWPADPPPQGERLFRDALLGYTGVFWLLQSLLMEPAAALLATLLEVGLVLIFSALMALLGRGRWPLSFMASLLMGATAVVGLVAIPVLAWLLVAESGERLLAFYLLLAIPLWGLAVIDHIFRHLLKQSPWVCFWLACGHAALVYLGTLSFIS